jgi:DNA-binding transcriptional regulator YhcF (GntR family)
VNTKTKYKLGSGDREIYDYPGIYGTKSEGTRLVDLRMEEEETKMRERMQPVLDAYVKSMKEKGLPGEEVLKWCQDYLKTAPLINKMIGLGASSLAPYSLGL